MLPQYKLTAKASQRPSANLIKRTLQEAFVGQFLMTPLAGYFGYHAFMIGGLPLDAKLPGLFELCKKFALGTFVSEHVIYLAHRTLHHKALYARFHKQHHSYVESMGISAEFAGPVEQLFVNFVPTLCGGALRGSHPFIFFFWLIYRLTETYETHSGYYFGDTFLGKLGLLHGESSSFHHAHHLENRGNFASWHVDALFGTMDAWLADGDYDGYLEKHLHGVVQLLQALDSRKQLVLGSLQQLSPSLLLVQQLLSVLELFGELRPAGNKRCDLPFELAPQRRTVLLCLGLFGAGLTSFLFATQQTVLVFHGSMFERRNASMQVVVQAQCLGQLSRHANKQRVLPGPGHLKIVERFALGKPLSRCAVFRATTTMDSRAAEELEALRAIYGDELAVEGASVTVVVGRRQDREDAAVGLRAVLPQGYPGEEAPVPQMLGWPVPVGKVVEELGEMFEPGEVVLFAWVEHVRNAWADLEAAAGGHAARGAEALGGGESPKLPEPPAAPAAEARVAAEVEVQVVSGEPFTSRKSTFQAHLARVEGVPQVEAMLARLRANPKIARASHNMLAYRIERSDAPGTFLCDNDDDGENAAGSKLAELLALTDAKNVAVVVSRWYGGVHLGPARFKIISNVARELLVQQGLVPRSTDTS
ncbi:Protein IMPACT (Imprinted and ancient gene protein homolog) [Durusdinium trenchii]|uniref:Protein IMPACT (Imprinted and ancient gene protein homolog) n=1 Tax=Durusdinium trenchii TaxID=1381693 RepID=A0ABP0IGX7_9DINO